MARKTMTEKALEMAKALDDGGADPFEAASIIRSLVSHVRRESFVLCGNCGGTYNSEVTGDADKHGLKVCGASSRE